MKGIEIFYLILFIITALVAGGALFGPMIAAAIEYFKNRKKQTS
jgi:hypothetical protein